MDQTKKTLAHPLAERSAVPRGFSRGRQIEKKFLQAVFILGRFLRIRHAALQYVTLRHVASYPVVYNADRDTQLGLRLFILGSTCAIALPVVRKLVKGGHDVWAAARSKISSSARSKSQGRMRCASRSSPPEPCAISTGQHVRAGQFLNLGAGEGIRTLDPDLGKVVLYH
jgi:hypothetical protein